MEEAKALFVIEKSDVIDKIDKQVDEAFKGVEGLVITDKDSMQKIADVILLGKKLHNKLKTARTAHLKPYKDVIGAESDRIGLLMDKSKKLETDNTPAYQVYVKEQERIEIERINAENAVKSAEIKKEADAKINHTLDVSAANNVDMTEQALDIEEAANKEIAQIASKPVEVKITNRSNLGTLSTTKTYKGEVIDKFELMKYIIASNDLGFDISYMVDFSVSGLNKFALMKKDAIIKAGGKIIGNGVKLYEKESLGGR